MVDFEKLTDINTVSEEVFSVSEYLDIARLPDIFNFTGTDTLPVIDTEGKIVGIVSEFDLASVVKKISLDENSHCLKIDVEDIMTRDVWVEKQGTDVLALFDKLGQMHARFIPIVDEDGVYTGKCITRTKLINFLTKKIKPRTIAGVSTPIGIYLTDGIHQVGAGNLGLILNGVLFAVFASLAEVFTFGMGVGLISSMMKLLIFLVLFKFSPLSQIHASEHKVINAIEKGLPLNFETVRMQSNIHKRCGTNFLILFLGIAFTFYVTSSLLPKIWIFRFLVSFGLLLLLFSYWRQIGYRVQEIFTTKEPSDAYLSKAIKVGEELLKVYKKEPKDKDISLLSLIFTSGTLQIVVSFLLFFNILSACLYSVLK